jgi:signal transduction histidine kinase
MRSLQARLAAGLIISLVLLFLLQWWIVSAAIRSLTERYVASRLQHDTENILAALLINGAPSLDPERIDPVYKRPFSGRYYQIRVGEALLRSRSLWDQELSIPPVNPGDQTTLHTSGPQEQTLLLSVSGFKKRDQGVTIAVAEDLSAMEADFRRFQLLYGLVSLAVLSILILTQRRVIVAGLAPLERARREVLSLERGEIDRLREEVPGEVQPLIREINRLLEAMQQRLQRSRNAMGNVTHALKGPFTLLMQLADREEMKRAPALQKELKEQTETIRQLLERELKRARLAGKVQPGRPMVLGEEVRHLVDALKRIYHEKSLEIEWTIPTERVFIGDREDILELLGNLLDNACKWGRSKVILHLEQGADGVLISVEDDGPGCPPEALQRLSERGVRIDESAVGHGLGLAIVKEIVTQYSGEIGFGRSDRLGGFLVLVKLPPYRRDSASVS